MHTEAVVNDARPGQYRATVIHNRSLSSRYYLLVLSRPEGLQEPAPGTFIHVAVPDPGRFFLRRPFSILDADDKTISLIIVEKGEGTHILRHLEEGSEVDVVGPLGSRFPRVPDKRVLALGGGVGLAPLYYYWKHHDASDCESFRLLYGARNRDDLFVDGFDWDVNAVSFASDDGSHGFHGNVVQLAETMIEAEAADVIFSCGPNAMLKAAAGFAVRHGLPHYVSLENRMACALGACRSCVVMSDDGTGKRYRTVCHDGPVFDADILTWDELPEA